jgi:hypothetical protein
MRNVGLTKTLLAAAAIGANLIVKFTATDTVGAAAASTDKLVGVSDLGADAAGDRVDVILDGIALVKAGGTVAAGDLVTANASGQAVATTTAADRYIGVAMDAGVSGDLIGVRLAPGLI